MAFRITTDFAHMKAEMRRDVDDRIRSAIVDTINAVAFEARAEVKTQIGKIFRNPEPITLNSVLVRKAVPKADISEISAEVFIRDELSGGIAPAKYLLTEEAGGLRANKRMEKVLQRKGLLMQGGFVTPGPGAALDARGQLLGGLVTQMLSRVGGLGEEGYQGNATGSTAKKIAMQARAAARRAARAAGADAAGIAAAGKNAFLPLAKKSGTNFFLARSKNSEGYMGIWKLLGPGHVVPVLWFVNKRPNYSPRFPFQRIVATLVEARFPALLTRALERGK